MQYNIFKINKKALYYIDNNTEISGTYFNNLNKNL